MTTEAQRANSKEQIAEGNLDRIYKKNRIDHRGTETHRKNHPPTPFKGGLKLQQNLRVVEAIAGTLPSSKGD